MRHINDIAIGAGPTHRQTHRASGPAAPAGANRQAGAGGESGAPPTGTFLGAGTLLRCETCGVDLPLTHQHKRTCSARCRKRLQRLSHLGPVSPIEKGVTSAPRAPDAPVPGKWWPCERANFPVGLMEGRDTAGLEKPELGGLPIFRDVMGRLFRSWGPAPDDRELQRRGWEKTQYGLIQEGPLTAPFTFYRATEKENGHG